MSTSYLYIQEYFQFNLLIEQVSLRLFLIIKMQITQLHCHLILLSILLIEYLYYIMNVILLFSFLCSENQINCFIEEHYLKYACLSHMWAFSLKMTCFRLSFG